MIAKTLYGLEDVLAKELKKLGAMDVKKGVRNVSFTGDTGFMYKANLSLHTAMRILKPIHQFRVKDEQELYDKIKRIDWNKYLTKDGTFSINSTVNSEEFTHSGFVVFRAKDAIVDFFREQTGERPSVEKEGADLTLDVHIENQMCSIALDSSGESLHKRKYKVHNHTAPINEVLAAGILKLSGWDGQHRLLDPMCGSGTFLIEAATIACNIPPNLKRDSFGFKRWDNFDPELYEVIKESVMKKIKDMPFTIQGADRSNTTIAIARENIEAAGMEDFITLKRQDFFSSKKENDTFLQLIMNPPYNERLEVDVEEFYAELGDTLKQNYPNSQAWMIVSGKEAMKNIGLRAGKKVKLYNGNLEARLLKFAIYQGSKKK